MRIVDAEKRVIGILAGHPDTDAAWGEVSLQAARCLEEAQARVGGSKRERDHRRGAFATLRSGISHGGGQTHPMNYSNSELESNILKGLNKKPCIRRIAGFGSSKPPYLFPSQM